MWVVLITDGLHLQHVLTTDALVAAFVEENGGIVAVVDDGISHQFRALIPAGTLYVLLGIAGRHRLNESHTVTRLDVLFPRCYMHPAHEVCTRLHHQAVAVVT